MLDTKKIPFSKIVKSQLPSYVREEFPLIGEFLTQYYFGQEVQGGTLDLIQNIDEYLKISENGKYVKESILGEDIDENDTEITLPDGNYTTTTLRTSLNTLFSNNSIDITLSQYTLDKINLIHNNNPNPAP